MSYEAPLQLVQTQSYVDTYLRNFISTLIREGEGAACRYMYLVRHAYLLMLRGSGRYAREFKELLLNSIPQVDRALLDAYPPDFWLDIALQACIVNSLEICKGPHAKYFSMCVHDRYRDVVLSDPREKVEPWCCNRVASVVIMYADEKGYARLAIVER